MTAAVRARAPSRLLEPVGRVRRKWQEALSDAEMHHRGFGDFARRLREAGVDRIEGTRLLDIGCGDRAPLSLLFAAAGARVSAIDLAPVTFGWERPVMWGRAARGAGPAEAGRQVVCDLVHTFRYWRRLSRLSSTPLPFGRVTVRQMDAERLDFPESSFEVVVSSAVWEHLADVGRATREVNRVLTPGGIALIQIALFPSLQGGHHAEWHAVEPGCASRRIRPWDHLRPGALPLPEVRAELAAYTGRDLLLLAVTVWARKREG